MVNFSQISPEILRKVFLHFVDLPSHNFHHNPAPGLYRSRDMFSTPLLLSHVCSSWRQVACSSPTLWSFLLLHRPSEKHMPFLHLWLLRSKNASLTIHLQSMATDQLVSQRKILHLLLQHSWRWKCFTVDIHGYLQSLYFSSELASFLVSKAFKFPALERVGIKFPPQARKQVCHSVRLCNLLYNIPSLLSVIMPVPCLKHHITLTEILCYDPMTFKDALNMLACCPNLQSIDINLSPYTLDSHSGGGISIDHRELSSVRLRNANDDSGTALRLLLDNLTLSHLIELDILFDDNTTEEIRAIYNLILRSNCYLRALSKLHAFGCSQLVMRLLCLPQLHNLRRLSLRRASKEILESLTLRSGGAERVILPFLEFLEVDEILPSVAGSTLSDLLLSRFDSLRAANIILSNHDLHTPLDNTLWSRPEYRITIQAGGKSINMLLGDEDNPGQNSYEEYVSHSWTPQLAV